MIINTIGPRERAKHTTKCMKHASVIADHARTETVSSIIRIAPIARKKNSEKKKKKREGNIKNKEQYQPQERINTVL